MARELGTQTEAVIQNEYNTSGLATVTYLLHSVIGEGCITVELRM